MPASVCRSLSVSGMRKPWQTITMLTKTSMEPSSPDTIVPGKTKISTAMHATPSKNKPRSASRRAAEEMAPKQQQETGRADQPANAVAWRHKLDVQPGQSDDDQKPVIGHQLSKATASSIQVAVMTWNSCKPVALGQLLAVSD